MGKYKPFSLITIVTDEHSDLTRFLMGIKRSTRLPDEVVIIDLNEEPIQITCHWVNLKIVHFPHSKNSSLSIASARNLGYESASYDLLCYLDPKCIPSRNFFKKMVRHARLFDGVIMGQMCHLTRPLNENWEPGELYESAIIPGDQPIILNVKKATDYHQFNGTAFVVNRAIMTLSNGFDMSYKGYGTEDVDFAFSCSSLDIPIYLSSALLFHEQRDDQLKERNVFHDLISNCHQFYKKWGEWTKQVELKRLSELGFINWTPDATEIKVLREPSEEEVIWKELHRSRVFAS